MNTLTPRIASRIAQLSYTVERSPKTLILPEIIKKHFSFNINNIKKGSSGGFFWRQETGFALIGKGHSELYNNDHVIAIRGTNTKADAITDITCHCKNSDSGMPVHKGFQSTFASLREGIASYMKEPEVLNGNGAIHCVGHSLGGAVATLVADWIKATYDKTVYLYTFGSPRVGKKGFAEVSGGRIDQIFRCVHASDPVTKVPVWPFVHTPNSGQEYTALRAVNISPATHSMATAPGYINTADHSSWSDIFSQKGMSVYQRVRLNYEDRLNAYYSTHWADKITAALLTLLHDGGFTALVSSLQTGAAAIGTVYDLMAQAVVKIASMVGFEEQVRGLLAHMIVFSGLAVGIPTKLTYSFIKWVFENTIARLLKAAKIALQSIA
ncbi:Lipase (class 3) [Marinomonas spartinae]|uniref:Lipase (Class 3) n=1 Tax=Marinomonas spartinae TaxID=1792290 RepID=A0A1A8T2B8_9GAMM|nr:lipase family protein [Marinomonas spartinae]SBS24794.1 Lipase (class 3) [Marinomonas spartinae]